MRCFAAPLTVFGAAASILVTASCTTKESTAVHYSETIPWVANYDESQVPPYELPDPLLCADGSRVGSAAEWSAKRRPELLRLFRESMFGDPIPKPDRLRVVPLTEKRDARGGLAVRRELRLDFLMADGRRRSVIMLLYLPAAAREKVPVCVVLTFGGNQSATVEDDVTMTGWQGKRTPDFIPPGGHARRFPIDEIMRRGYALAIASYHDFFPDYPAGWQVGVCELFHSREELEARPAGASAITAWAWGYSRLLDCLETLPEIDSTKAVAIGHSRLGKAALWAGAQDERFRVVGVNDAGCGGPAPNRRLFGETLFSMYHKNGVGKWWFAAKMEELCAAPEKLPFDQHELVALVAPRAVAVHSATLDEWADPRGEYLGAYHAGAVWRLFGKTPLASPEPPPPDTPVGTDVSYFLRTGKHDLLDADWRHYLDVADRVFGRTSPAAP